MTVARDIPQPPPHHEDPTPPAPFREQVAAELRAHLARRRISGRTLAKLVGENQTWVSRRLAGHVPLDTDDLQRIADALDMSPMELLAGVPFGVAVHHRTAPITNTVVDRITSVSSGKLIMFPRVGRSPHPGFGEDAA